MQNDEPDIYYRSGESTTYVKHVSIIENSVTQGDNSLRQIDEIEKESIHSESHITVEEYQ